MESEPESDAASDGDEEMEQIRVSPQPCSPRRHLLSSWRDV